MNVLDSILTSGAVFFSRGLDLCPVDCSRLASITFNGIIIVIMYLFTVSYRRECQIVNIIFGTCENPHGLPVLERGVSQS